MTPLLQVGLSNLAMAAALALVAAVAGRCLRRPALTHALWLLVFVKLITPPLLPLPMGWMMPEPALMREASSTPPTKKMPLVVAAAEDSEQRKVSAELARLEPEPAAPVTVEAHNPDPLESTEPVPAATTSRPPPGPASVPKSAEPARLEAEVGAASPVPWLLLAGGLWFGGSLAWFLLSARRLNCFQRLLRGARVAPVLLQEETRQLADKLGIPCPPVWLVPGQVSPMLWVRGGQARLLLPEGLLRRLNPDQRCALLVHELAHWRRRDHWVRRLELVVLGLYWWCPLVWWARAELEQAEEECCDAWVVWALPGAARDYALALVETVDFLSGAKALLPPVASGMGQVHHLRRRLTMILSGKTPRALTVSGILTVVALAALLLPWMPSWAQEPRAVDPVATTQREDPAPQGKGFPGKREDLERARAELQRMQAELERMKVDLERRAHDLKLMTERMIQGEKTKSSDRPGEGAKEKDKKPRGFGPGAPGGAGGFGPGAGGFGPGSGDVNRRLDALEHKLDRVLEELRSLRQKGSRGAGGSTQSAPSLIPGAVAPPQTTLPPIGNVPSVPSLPSRRPAPATVPATPAPPANDIPSENPLPRSTPSPAPNPQAD